ncbi:DUF5641 domain-containing protein [Trichonephila clavipes]|nr:DUF5641 domain-containing protein [Trichonephila clavipes]
MSELELKMNSLPPPRLNFDSNLSNRKVLIKRFNYRERLLNMFWTKWLKEYIFMLKSAHCVKPTGEIKEFKIDDVVLINDEKFPRHFWKLGKVVDVFPGRNAILPVDNTDSFESNNIQARQSRSKEEEMGEEVIKEIGFYVTPIWETSNITRLSFEKLSAIELCPMSCAKNTNLY